MPFGNAIFMALLLVLHIAGITGAIWSDAEQAVHSFADVACQRRFELEIHSSSTEWYRNGMQLFSFSKNGYYWVKKHITWTVYNHTKTIPMERVKKIIGDAFAKWAAVTNKTFEHVEYTQKPDIFIKFGYTEDFTEDGSRVCFLPQWPPRKKLDDLGPGIVFDHLIEYTDTTRKNWRNLGFLALSVIGQVLGLGATNCTGSVLHHKNPGPQSKNDPKLDDDDILGIQALYGAPPGWPTGTSNRRNPVSAPNPPNVSSDDDDSTDDDNFGANFRKGLWDPR